MLRLEDFNTGLIYTELKECLDCNKCIHECPILKSNVSMLDMHGSRKMCVDEKECILCGTCIDTCVHNARHYRDDCDAFLSELKQGREFSVLVAPAFYLAYPNEGRRIMGYLQSLGVKKFYSVGFGADIGVWAYINHMAQSGTAGNLSQPCPVVVNFIEKHLPKLLPSLIPVQSPMMCLAIYLKRYMGIKEDLVFLGPCIAKKMEMQSKRGLGLVRHNVTFKNLIRHISENGIDLAEYLEARDEIEAGMGALLPSPGGLRANLEYYLGPEASIFQLEGEYKIYDFFRSLAANENGHDEFIPMLMDVLNCERGCSYGTGAEPRPGKEYGTGFQAIAMRMKKYGFLKDENQQPLVNYPDRLARLNDNFKELKLEDFMCEYDATIARKIHRITDDELEAIFTNELLKFTDRDRHIDCSACGYKTCRYMAIAIAFGINHRGNCVYYVKDSLVKTMEEIKATEERLRITLDNMRQEKEKVLIAEENSQIKSKFLAQMSHEIRTPISTVLGITEIQLRKNIPVDIRESFSMIYTSANILLRIVNDILDLSKIEAGKMELIHAKYEVVSFISDVVQLNLVYLGSKKLKFTVDVDKGMPASLGGDELRMRQIMNNLLSNAFKYTEDGTVSLKVHTVPGENDGSVNLVVVIRDTGRGMTKEQTNRLFDDYSRFHEKAARFVSGTGLGMSITLKLLNLMGASIDIESEVGKGTTVTTIIPQTIEGKELLGEETARNIRNLNMEKWAEAKRKNLIPEPMPYGRVLVVDDVDINLLVVEGILAWYEISVETAQSGLEAIEKIEAGEVYDIIFMDHMMPDMDGIEATKVLRGMGYTYPIVALTANALVGQAEKFLRNGFDGFLSKPIQTECLNSLLHKYVKDRHPGKSGGKKLFFHFGTEDHGLLS